MRNTLTQQSDLLRIDPSSRVWERLDKRLEQDKGKIRVSVVRRWMAVAASMVILILSTQVFPLKTHGQIIIMEDLQILPDEMYSTYVNAVKLNEIFHQHGMLYYLEGPEKKLIPGGMREDNSLNTLAP